MKRGLQVRYDASEEEAIKGVWQLWKKHPRKRIGPHAFAREIPGDEAGPNTVKKFKEDYDVHTASQCCITTGTLTGVVNLDVKLPFSIEDEDKMIDTEEMSLRDILMDVKVEGKQLIRVLANVDVSTAPAISATSEDRDAALANICQYTSPWAMYTLVFKYKAATASVEVALKSWFELTHAKAAMEFSEYDMDTGLVSLDVSSGDQEGREVQELLSEGLVDMSILKGGDVDTGKEVTGRGYDSDDSDMTRGSQNTTMYQNRIFGLKAAAKRKAAQENSKRPEGQGDVPPSSPAHGGDTAAEKAGSGTGLPPPQSGAGCGAEAEDK